MSIETPAELEKLSDWRNCRAGVRTADGNRAAHYEHTVVITRGEPILPTAA